MIWTYSGDPSANVKDRVRSLIGDTDSGDKQFSDLEINAELTETSQEPYGAAVRLVELLIAKFARKADKRIDDLDISYSQVVKNYRKLLVELRQRATLEAAAPYAGGISVSDVQANTEDADVIQPTLKRGMHDN